MVQADFSRVGRLDCPLIVFAGRFDETTPNAPVRQWFDKVDAPGKRWVWFENSAHEMYLEEPGRALVSLVEVALPLAHATPRLDAPRTAVHPMRPTFGLPQHDG